MVGPIRGSLKMMRAPIAALGVELGGASQVGVALIAPARFR